MTDETTIIDRIDRRIVDELQQNARISWRELGDRVHLAPSSVADRVRRLEERGLIRGYSAQVDPAAFGRSVRAVIDVGLPRPRTFQMQTLPEFARLKGETLRLLYEEALKGFVKGTAASAELDRLVAAQAAAG